MSPDEMIRAASVGSQVWSAVDVVDTIFTKARTVVRPIEMKFVENESRERLPLTNHLLREAAAVFGEKPEAEFS